MIYNLLQNINCICAATVLSRPY